MAETSFELTPSSSDSLPSSGELANQQQNNSNEEQSLVLQLQSPPVLDTLFSHRESQDKSSSSSSPPTKTMPFNDSQQLRSYFSELLVTRHTPSRQQTSRRQGLTGLGRV